jgi:hypothetical protein
MNDGFDQILKDIPMKGSRSKLESHARLIEELLRRGRTYREIVSIMREKCDVQASISTLHFFVRRRAKQARKQKRFREMTPRIGDVSGCTREGGFANPRKSQAEEQEVRQRIAALKRRKTPLPENSEQFRYDPSEPLRMPTKLRP